MKFNPEKPYNELPLLPPKINLADKDFLIKTITTAKAVSQLRAHLTFNKRTINNALDLLSPLFIPEAVASSNVENIITTNDQIYIAQIKEKRELSPAEKETLRYADALREGIKLIHGKQILATNDYIRLQNILVPEFRGIRNLPGTHLSNPATGKIYYTPPSGEKSIRDKLANYEKYDNDKAPDSEIYSRMAVLHYQLEMIHPFFDGNGRTGRILMPLYLMLQGELQVPVLFISRYIMDHRDEYYEKLRGVTERSEWKAWILYIMEATRSQAEYTTNILAKIQKNIVKDKKFLREKYRKIYSSELVDFIFSHAYFTAEDFAKEMEISRPTSYHYLEILISEGIIKKKQQDGRNRNLYANPHYINILLDA